VYKHIIDRPTSIQNFDRTCETESLEGDAVATALDQNRSPSVSISLPFVRQRLRSLVPAFFGV
jgi:hypothetical protein